MDRWDTKNIVCDGGLILTADLLEQGELLVGSARALVNYEPAEDKGYRRIAGYIKWDEDQVPGDTDSPILLAYPCLNGVVAARTDTSSGTDNAIYYSEGTGWTKVNGTARGGSVAKVRAISYNITGEVVIITDEVNHAIKWDGSTATTLNSTDAPAAPKYAAEHLQRLALAGHSTGSILTLSAPNADNTWTAAGGALEFNVGDTITGLKEFRETLYIFCENSIKKLVGSTEADFVLQNVTDQIGCLEHDTIQEVAGDLLYLAPDGLRSLAATERVGDVELGLQTKSIEPLILGMLQLLPATYCSCTVPRKSQYRLFYYQSGIDAASQKGFLGKHKPTETGNFQWAETQGFAAYSAGTRYINGDEIAVFGHITNGYVYQMEIGGSRDGADIAFSYRTPPLIFGDINTRKVLQRLRSIIEAFQDTTVSVRAILDEYYSEDIQPTAKIITINGDAIEWDDPLAIWDAFDWGGNTTPYVLGKKMEGSGYTITFEFTGSNQDLPHKINSLTIEYAQKGRR